MDDPQGCGDGNPWYLEDEGVILFDTRQEAEEAGYNSTLDTIYRFELGAVVHFTPTLPGLPEPDQEPPADDDEECPV